MNKIRVGIVGLGPIAQNAHREQRRTQARLEDFQHMASFYTDRLQFNYANQSGARNSR